MESRKYVLAIKRHNNDYLPLEWQVTPFYHGENLSTLEGIDAFTKSLSDVDLLLSLTELNIVSMQEAFQSFAIIFQEKGRIRELKEGPIFSNYNIFKEDEFIYFIITNMSNKKLINRIYNLCSSIKEEDENLTKFKLALNNLDTLEARSYKAPVIALSVFLDISYDIKRTILVRFTNKVLKEHLNETNPDNKHIKVPETEEKIA